MRHRGSVGSLFFLLLLGAGPLQAAPGSPPGAGTLLVGAASDTVLPLVNGSHDYLNEGFPERGNLYDPGIAVPAWDDGRIAVGNGESESYWVHDDIRATAVAIDDPRSPHIVVILATDLYMVFRSDAEPIRARAAKLLPPGIAGKLKVIVSASHNHHGPDTAFDVNHGWYEYMTNQAAAVVASAVANRRPARLQVAAGEHWLGMNDGTDPQIFDPRLNALQAIDTRGAVIATLVQWNNHPEATLGWSPPLSAIEDDRVAPRSVEPREARTTFTRIATFELPLRVDRYPSSRYALVELTPHTGRRHQLRRHLASESHPIVGDSTYGKGKHNRLFRDLFGVPRLLLACTRLEFTPPASATTLRVEAPLAAEFAGLLTRLGTQYAADPLSSPSP